MDPDDQPSTSKKAKTAGSSSENILSHTMYPVTFEQFKKFVNVEEFVLKEMERAGSEVCRINYKIRHKYYPAVYKQFYSNIKTREKMFRKGLTLKPIPKSIKEKLMLMPGEDDESSTRTHKHQEKPPENKSKVRCLQETSCAIPANRESNHLKENLPKPVIKPVSTSKKQKPLVEDSLKITSFFTALASAQKSPEVNSSIRKRKSDVSTENAETKPQIKRLKDSASSRLEPISNSSNNSHRVNKNHTKHLIKAKTKRTLPMDLVSNDSDGQTDIQIMVDVAVPPNAELNHSKENVLSPKNLRSNSRNKAEQIKTEARSRERKRVENKPKSNKRQTRHQCKSSLDDEISDDSDIKSYIEVVNLCTSSRGEMESPNLSVKLPLLKRNRIEDFKKPTLSQLKNKKREEWDRNQLKNSYREMRVSGIDIASMGRTEKEIHEWLEKGLKALELESGEEQNPTEYFTQEFIAVDRLKAINTYPEEVRKYITYLLKLEILKRKDINTKAEIPGESSKSKVVSAFLKMTFDDYKCLINAEKLLSERKTATESVDTITGNLKKQYEAFIGKEKPWPKGLHIKLSTLKKYLISKGLREPIQLKDIPPRILCFEEVLEYTNLKECTSLNRKKPPDSYKYLLHLCKKEYTKSCLDGVWIEGIRFTNIKDVIEEPGAVLEKTLTESISMPPLRVFSSDLRSTYESSNKAIVGCNAVHSGTQEVVDNVLNESDKVMSAANVNSSVKLVEVESHENTNNSKSPKHNAKSSHQKAVQRQIRDNEEIEKDLDEIFKSATNTQEPMHTIDDVITDNNELRRTLSKDADSPIQPPTDICQTTKEQRTTKEINVLQSSLKESEDIIIDDSPDSVGELLNVILQPSHATPLESSAKPSEIINLPPNNELPKSPKETGLIPPSPNLFQSSGESDPKCSQSQQLQMKTPETVYIPCKHSMTYNTEEHNLTALSLNQTSDNPDPFADANTNQDATIVEGMNVTTLITPDPNIVVKQEYLSMRDEDVERCYVGLDDSVQIIDLPPPEPIVIEDEETAPDLLEMLLSRPTKASNEKTALENLTQLQSSNSLESFPQAQRLPSNLDLTASQSKVNPLHIKSTMSQTENNVSERITKATVSENRSDNAEFKRNDEETVLKAQRKNNSIGLNPTVNKIDTALLDKKANEKQNYAEIVASNLIVQPGRESSPNTRNTSQEHSISNCIESRQLSKETPLSGSLVETSYVFIAPQNIPSDIDLTQSSSNKSSNEPMNPKEGDCGLKKLVLSKSFFAAASKSGKFDQQTSKDIGESINCNQESVMSVYHVYVTKEGDISKVVSSSNDTQTAGNTESSMNIDESSMVIENTAVSKGDTKVEESATCAQKTSKDSSNVRSSENVSINTLEDLELQKKTKDSEYVGTHPANQNIFQLQDVQLLKYNKQTKKLQSSMSIQDTEASSMPVDVVQDAVVSTNIAQISQLSRSTQGIDAENMELSLEDGEHVEKNQRNKVSFTTISQTNAHFTSNMTQEVNDNSKTKFYDSSEVELLEETESFSINDAGKDGNHNSIKDSIRGELSTNSPNDDISKSIVNAGVSTYDSRELSCEAYSELTEKIQEDSGDLQNKRGVCIPGKDICACVNKPRNNEFPKDQAENFTLTANGLPEGEEEIDPEELAKNLKERTEHINACRTVEQIDVCESRTEVDIETNKSDRQTEVQIGRNLPTFQAKNKEGVDRELMNNNQLSESGHFPTEFGGPEVNLDIPEQSMTIASKQIKENTNSSSILICNRQPVTHKRNVINIRALLPIAAVQNDQNNEAIETSSIIDGLDGDIGNEDLIEVPFLINRRFIESLPFDIVTGEQMMESKGESTFYAIKANLELKLDEDCLSINMCHQGLPEINKQLVIANEEAQLSPTINRCQFDEKVIRDWLGYESIITNNMVPAATSINMQQKETGREKSPKMDGKAHMKDLKVNTDVTSNIVGVRNNSNPQIIPHTEKTDQVQSSEGSSKSKPGPKSKKKESKKSAKKQSESDFVPQRTHAFRSLPLGASKKPVPSEIELKEPSPTTIEEIDYLIEDASQVIVSSTASQILCTDNTYFEGSQLLRNIDNYCVPEQQIHLTKEQTPSAEPQVNIFKRITTMCEGIMARKIWQVNLQLKTREKIEIEVRFVADKRSLTVCGKSAELLFNFSPAIWFDVLRVLREIDHFEYKRNAAKNYRAITPLHDVLRSLFDSATQVVNIKLINDSFTPYVTCEKVPSVYRKPFQCLTKAIPPCILNKMKALKEKLRNNNSEG